jgi:hypothetical protein
MIKYTDKSDFIIFTRGELKMSKKYLISETTKVERQKIANDALGISTLDAQEPTVETMLLVQEYVDGKKEISEILKQTIEKYKVVSL